MSKLICGNVEVKRVSRGDRLNRLSALAKARLTPAVEDSVNQVIGNGMIFGDILMALFAFPRALMTLC